MHELSLICSMIDEVEVIAKKEGAKEILSLTVAIGELSGVDREAFEFAYPVAVEGTFLKDTVLHIEEIPAAVKCGDCDKVSQPDIPVILCQECRSNNVDIIEGRELIIRSIELNT